MQRGFPALKPADASHIVSAAATNVAEMHTFDERLLSLDGKIMCADGTNLKICKPSMGGPALPLLEGVQDEEGEIDADEPEDIAELLAFEPANASIHGSGAGTGMPGGRDSVRSGAGADSLGGAAAEACAEEADP